MEASPPRNPYVEELFEDDASEIGIEDLTGEGLMQGGGEFYQELFSEEFVNSSYMSSTSSGSTPRTSTPTGSTPRTSTPLSSTPSGSTPRTSTPPGSIPSAAARWMAIPTSTTPPDNVGGNKGKKRTRMGDDVKLNESMENWYTESLVHMRKMANSMGYEKELSARRATIPTLLEKLELSLTQQFKLGAVIGEKDETVDQFLNTRDEVKQAWVEAVWRGEVFGPIV